MWAGSRPDSCTWRAAWTGGSATHPARSRISVAYRRFLRFGAVRPPRLRNPAASIGNRPSRKGHSAGDGDSTGGTAGVEVRDPRLFPGRAAHRLLVGQEQAERAGPHRGAIAGVRRWSARLIPGHTHEQPERGRAGTAARADITPLPEELGEPPGEHRGLPSSSLQEAAQQLPGKLGVVAVLTEGKLLVGPFSCASGSKPSLDVNPGHLR